MLAEQLVRCLTGRERERESEGERERGRERERERESERARERERERERERKREREEDSAWKVSKTYTRLNKSNLEIPLTETITQQRQRANER